MNIPVYLVFCVNINYSCNDNRTFLNNSNFNGIVGSMRGLNISNLIQFSGLKIEAD